MPAYIAVLLHRSGETLLIIKSNPIFPCLDEPLSSSKTGLQQLSESRSRRLLQSSGTLFSLRNISP